MGFNSAFKGLNQVLEIASCQRHLLYKRSVHCISLSWRRWRYYILNAFFQIVFSERIIICVQFTPYHPHENRTSSDLANVETTIPCILFCSQKHNAQNYFSVNRRKVLRENCISSHVNCVMQVLQKKKKRLSYPSCTRSTPHTNLNVKAWHFVGLTQHVQQTNACYFDSVYTHTKPSHVAETKQIWGFFLSSQFKTTLIVQSVCRTYCLQQHTIAQLTED